MTKTIIIIDDKESERVMCPCPVCKRKGKVPDLNNPWVINLGWDNYKAYKTCPRCGGSGEVRC